MTTSIPVQLPVSQLAAYCRRWKIVRLELFGSALRDDFTDESDLDFLATWAHDAQLGLAGLEEAETELAQIVGRPVDLVSRRAVERCPIWLRREAILRTTRELYAA